MYKLPNKLPSLRDSAQEWADYAEFSAFNSNRISILNLIKASQLTGDEIQVEGIEDETDQYINKTDEISIELNHRINLMGDRYPFSLTDNAYSLEIKGGQHTSYLVYKFLLFATRISMKSDKVHNNLDGTKLFEELSAQVVSEFLGENANVDIIGTSNSDVGGFRTKLDTIAARIGEGTPIRQNPHYRPQDDTIDVIAWKGFSDKLSSQLIAFGQCKTGTSWRNRLSELNAEAFCKRWFSTQPVVTPLRMFFCAQYFPKEIWYELTTTAGLVFDRFRIIDYLPEQLDQNLFNNLTRWTEAAHAKYLA